MAARSLPAGTKIRVDLTARIAGGRPFADGTTFSTLTPVRETRPSRWTHYLYLESPHITRNDEGTITAAFDAVVAGPAAAERNATTKIHADGYTHFVYLSSSGITVIEKETAEEEAEEAAMIPARDVITSGEAAARIAELSGRQQYEVVRARNGEVLKNCADEATAAQFITDEDYDPARVVVRRQGLDAAGGRELELLRRLSADLAGPDSEWTVYRAGYFSADWARGEAVAVLGTAAGMLTAWPLNLVDWGDAAAERRDDCYNRAGRYGGTDFYISTDAIDD